MKEISFLKLLFIVVRAVMKFILEVLTEKYSMA